MFSICLSILCFMLIRIGLKLDKRKEKKRNDNICIK